MPDFLLCHCSSIVKYNVRKQIVKRIAKKIYTYISQSARISVMNTWMLLNLQICVIVYISHYSIRFNIVLSLSLSFSSSPHVNKYSISRQSLNRNVKNMVESAIIQRIWRSTKKNRKVTDAKWQFIITSSTWDECILVIFRLCHAS